MTNTCPSDRARYAAPGQHRAGVPYRPLLDIGSISAPPTTKTERTSRSTRRRLESAKSPSGPATVLRSSRFLGSVGYIIATRGALRVKCATRREGAVSGVFRRRPEAVGVARCAPRWALEVDRAPSETTLARSPCFEPRIAADTRRRSPRRKGNVGPDRGFGEAQVPIPPALRAPHPRVFEEICAVLVAAL